MKIFSTLFLAILTLCSCKERQQNVLIIGTNAEFPPFTFLQEGQIVGFDIDIAKEVGKRLQKEIQFKDMPFEALIPELILGNIHLIAAGMSPTEERAKKIFFTKLYLNSDPLVIFSKTEIADVAGKRVVVNDGFTADLTMSKRSDIELIRLPTVADAFLAIKAGRADVFVTAKSTALAFLDTAGNEEYYMKPIENSADTCALAISQKYPELLPEIQQALDTMKDDGTITKIKAKWKFYD